MKVIEINKGLRLPLAGAPVQNIENALNPIRHFAVTGPDYVGMKPTMLVEVGDRVKAGQPLFEDKKNPGVFFTAPTSGKVLEIYRGDRRAFRSVFLEADRDENDAITFEHFDAKELTSLDESIVRKNLIASGYWTALRTRPYDKIPAIDSTPNSLFVTAIDTNPLAPRPMTIIAERKDDFLNGLKVLSRIAGKKIFLCVGESFDFPEASELPFLETVRFLGPHPAGLPGTHIHFLDPVGGAKKVWHVNYQDVIAVGQLFTTGKFSAERVISLAGPLVKNPRLIRTRLGACLKELTDGELLENKEPRIISGNVLCGRKIEDAGLCVLGRYHNQVTVIEELQKRTFWEWLYPGVNLYSVTRTILSSFLPPRWFSFNTGMHGGRRAIFPTYQLEKVMPLDMMPVYLFRALEIRDIEQAESLGALELSEEDVALCTFVDPGKNDFGAILRNVLTKIEQES
ncbi:MAG: Na(+)-translocating NADH-quinone reductase subunit A [Planctomycetaceae bacterium]|jgi:Na+-transporting NADH:ubiquinone oxidoreductase subunit A|nr:Na(+)-translocating NADH-quinone reductase subunit A [Planctomycetaceae bacterium]